MYSTVWNKLLANYSNYFEKINYLIIYKLF